MNTPISILKLLAVILLAFPVAMLCVLFSFLIAMYCYVLIMAWSMNDIMRRFDITRPQWLTGIANHYDGLQKAINVHFSNPNVNGTT